ncbi:hypothetical protein EST38_g6521 [Candolleomyces aberdarensis]|uniref:Uncharacterized protein n=1 Tax=Candolleomyces aberdarensis TaxID=2316362 RepID=A0A4Q2DJN1_9AGAR|nr:hypothetical protein EST38_g6521 [Candolleomyces aberdarensis]
MSRDSNSLEHILRALFELRGYDHQQGSESEATPLSGVSLGNLRTLLLNRNATTNLRDDTEDDEYVPDDDDDDDEDGYLTRRRYMSRRQKQWIPSVTEPQAAGVELLNSGDFGCLGPKHKGKPNLSNVTKSILGAASKPPSYVPGEEIKTNFVPNTNGTTVATYDANIYTAQFSGDSSFYYTCAQDFKLHIFDMTKPPRPFGPVQSRMPRAYGRSGSIQTSLPLRKEIQGQHGQWTVTDANLSPDNSRIIYSSITSTAYMTSTSPEGPSEQIPIHFGDRAFFDHFGIWSCRFSADGNEIVAGGDGKIFVYDLLANRRTVKISAHEDDVNSCCWADTGSGNVLISASDDTFLKVWDRRSLGASRKPSGVLVGHTEGITYVSAKGDGRCAALKILKLFSTMIMAYASTTGEYTCVLGIPPFMLLMVASASEAPLIRNLVTLHTQTIVAL